MPYRQDRVMHELSLGGGVEAKRGTADDLADMARMGKSQDFQRNFQFISIFGFSMLLMASWEWSLSASTIGLANGGTAGLIWMFLVCWIGFLFINLSMAEMGSMAPTSGGQYHWVSEFSPRKYQRFLSYLIGWLCVLGWQTSCASSAYLSGTQIQGLVALNYPDYEPEPWHGTVLTMGVAGFSVLFNTVLAKKLPFIDGIVLVIHIFGFFGILVTLWVLSPTAGISVFTQFYDGGDWGLGGSALAGITSGILPLLGADAAAHMSEEVQNAGKTIPQSMISTTIFNGALAWIMIITYCFCVGSLPIEEVLNSPTGYPYLEIFHNATESRVGASAMAVLILVMIIFSNVTIVATASRQLFAFSRDKALPFSRWFSSIRYDLPLNAILTTFIFSSLLSTINIGSSAALNSITTLGSSALLSSYVCSIGCMIWRRWTNQALLPSKFSLGTLGLAINIIAELFVLVFFCLSFFPAARVPDATNMNWSILVFGSLVSFSIVYYFIKGRHVYEGPVEYVRKSD